MTEFTPLQLTDLVPQNSTFKLSGHDHEITLRRWTLRVREWAVNKYTSKGLQLAFSSLDIGVISDLAFFMLDDESKKAFKTKDDFLDAVVTVQDQINLIKALMQTIGVGEPELKRLTDAMANKPAGGDNDPNLQAPTP